MNIKKDITAEGAEGAEERGGISGKIFSFSSFEFFFANSFSLRTSVSSAVNSLTVTLS